MKHRKCNKKEVVLNCKLGQKIDHFYNVCLFFEYHASLHTSVSRSVVHHKPEMEEIFLRFPHLGESIFILLDNKSISSSREVDIRWKTFLDQEASKKFQIRLIKSTLNIGNSWNIIFKTFSRQDLGELGIAVRKFAAQNIEVMQYNDPYKILEDISNHFILLLPLAIFHFSRIFIKKLTT